jgi:hypothetical protein
VVLADLPVVLGGDALEGADHGCADRDNPTAPQSPA